jgi:hypothetical protein
MPSDTDVGKRVLVDVEEGEIGVEADAAVEESEGNPAGAKARTCYIGRSLMTQADLDALRLEGCFEPGICRLPGKETTPKPRKNESVVFRDFFTAGLRLPVSKKFADILAAYGVQIHQLTPNSIPQVLKFLWACRTFAGDNDVETFVRHFEIHWARRLVKVDDEDKLNMAVVPFRRVAWPRIRLRWSWLRHTRTNGLTDGLRIGFMFPLK